MHAQPLHTSGLEEEEVQRGVAGWPGSQHATNTHTGNSGKERLHLQRPLRDLDTSTCGLPPQEPGGQPSQATAEALAGQGPEHGRVLVPVSRGDFATALKTAETQA